MPCSWIYLLLACAFCAQIIVDCRRYSRINTTDQTGLLMSWSSSGNELVHIKAIPSMLCLVTHAVNPHGCKHAKDLQDSKYGSNTKSIQKAHGYGMEKITESISETKHIIISKGDRYEGTRSDHHCHFTVVNYPHKTFTVLEPGHPGGCQNDTMYTVMETAKQKHCIVAVNAGFFENTGYFGKNLTCIEDSKDTVLSKHGEWVIDQGIHNVWRLKIPDIPMTIHALVKQFTTGTTISDGRFATDYSGAQTAHFGITKDGYLHIGYLTKSEVESGEYEELIGSTYWLIRDGEVYLTESIKIGCQDEDHEELMTLDVNTVSGRTAVGYDKDGRILIMQVDGRTAQAGLTLYEFANILLDYGFVEAINLDSGGSTTFVVNGILANYPSDICKNNKKFNCARKLSTVLCVHQPEKFPYSSSPEDNQQRDDYKSCSCV